MNTFAPYVKFATIYENKLVITHEPIDGKRHQFTKSEYHKNPTNEKYTGTLSKNARRQIDKRLHGWIYAMLTAKSNKKGKKRTNRRLPTFVTLTLPSTQRHSDKVIKSKCLELFIKRLQYSFNVTHYFWRAEVQQNGNIHFHLIFDKFIKKELISKHWNAVLENLEYISEFEKIHGHRNPPTTNIQKLYSNSANIWYLLKYVAKESKGRLIEGAVYRFSQSLRNVKPLKIILEGQAVNKLRSFCRGKVKRVFTDDFFAVVYFKKSSSLLPFFNSLGAEFQEVTEKCFRLLYPTEPPPRAHLQPLPAPASKHAQQLLCFHLN